MEDNPSEIIDRVKLFFSQQAELYGDEMFLSQQSPVNSDPQQDKEVENIGREEDKKTTGVEFSQHPEFEKEKELAKKPKTIKVTEESSIFEGAVLTESSWKIDPHWQESDSLQELSLKFPDA